MVDISIPWGDESLTVALPQDWKVVQTARASLPGAGEDWPDRLAAALAKPEALPPLSKMLTARRSGRISVIVEDSTRHSPLQLILPIVFRELQHANIPAENVEIVFATGMHPPLSREEAAGKIGAELAGRFAWRSNRYDQAEAHERLGAVKAPGGSGIDLLVDRRVAAASLRILVCSVSPHLQAGFGGGYKMLVPGCSHLETIRQLHTAGLSRRPVQQVGQSHDANHMRRLIDLAGAAIDRAGGATFGVQYVLDAGDQVSAIAAGDVTACQRLLAKIASAGYGTVIESPADVVIANAYPRDLDLWQALKAVVNTSWAVRENGVLICLARCPAGVNNMPTRHLPVSQKTIRGILRLVGGDSLASLATRLVPGLGGERAFFVRLAMQVLRRHAVLIVSGNLAREGVRMIGMPVYAEPGDAFAAADAQLGTGPKRVIVFPTAGMSYPVLRQ